MSGMYKTGQAKAVWAGEMVVQLPHRCDEWVIGGPDAVRQMIRDLQALLPELKHPERYSHTHTCDRCKETRTYERRVCARARNSFLTDGCDWWQFAPLCYSCHVAQAKAVNAPR
jgi:hypothetical protein